MDFIVNRKNRLDRTIVQAINIQHMKESRVAPIGMHGSEFKMAGHLLVDRIAGFIDSIGERPVTTRATAAQLKQITGFAPLPEKGEDAQHLLNRAVDLLIEHGPAALEHLVIDRRDLRPEGGTEIRHQPTDLF